MGFVTLREQITDFDSCSQQCLSALLMSDANTVVEQNGYFFCQCLLMLPFKLLILLASPLLTSSLSSFPPFFPVLSNLVSRYTSPSPIFTSLTQPFPLNSSLSLFLAAEAQLLRISHKDRDVSSIIYWHLFFKVVPHQFYSTSYT